MTEEPTDGWSLVAQHEKAARLIGTIVALDPDVVYSRWEIAEAAELPLKTLSLAETLDEFATTGLIRRVDDSEALAAARTFDDAVTEQLAPEPSE